MKTAAIVAFALAAGVAAAQDTERKPATLISNGTVTVTSDDFEAFLLRVPEKNRVEARASYEWIGKATDTVFENRVLAAEARRLGYDKDPIIALRLKQSEEALLAQVWSDRVRKQMKLPDLTARARELYMSSKSKYTEPELVSGNVVFISTQGRTKEHAREIAESVRSLALAGTPFDQLAASYSEDVGFKTNKGKLQYVKRSDLEPAMGEAVFRLKPGEITAPIESQQHGFLVFQLEKRFVARVRPFEEVKNEIMEEELEKVRAAAVDNAVTTLKSPSTMVVDTKNVEALRVAIDPALIERAHQEALKGMAAREQAPVK